MSCNCRNSFAQFLPWNYKPKQEAVEKPKVKVVKRKKKPETQEENK